MGWETRRGKLYYYEKTREGGRVVSKYLGAGVFGQIAAGMNQEAREERQRQRDRLKMECAALDSLGDNITALCEGIDTLARATLILAGYHRHDRGHWRKRREAVSDGRQDTDGESR